MSFNTREQFVEAASSEKITLAHVNARTRLFTWTLDSGAIYKRQTPNFVVGLKQNDTELTQVSTLGSISEGSFFYDVLNSTVYVWNVGDTDPSVEEMIVSYRLFFSTAPIQTSNDLTVTGEDVHYDGRILSTPGYKHKIGIDQKLVSIVGTGNLRLENSDGDMDSIFDKYIWENQSVELYSWNRDLPISEAKIFYRGRITKKDFTVNIINFTIKDSLFDLETNVPQAVFGSGVGVRDAEADHLKRWVYGRVDGLKAQSTDQIGQGYNLTGTVTVENAKKEITQFSGIPAGSGLESKYFFISDENNDYTYWYDYGSSTPPSTPGRELISISIDVGDSASEVDEKTSIKLAQKFNILPNFGYFSTENKDFGEVNDASDVNTGATITKIVDGTNENTLLGVGTIFLSEVSPNDSITIGTQSFTVDSVESDTKIFLSKNPEFTFTGQTAILVPEIPVVTKNREFFVADHACAELTKTVVNALQFNRIIVSDTDGLFAGDFVEFAGGVRREIKNVAPGNIIVLRQNVPSLPAIGSNVVRQPIQQVFVGSEAVNEDDFTLSNTTELTITLDSDTEFNIASQEDINNIELTFTNGSRTVTKTANDVNMTEILSSRDYLRPQDLTYTTFFEILSVTDDTITLRVPFSDPTITDNPTIKRPEYIGDDSVISVNLLGKTVDGTATGDWIRTSAEVVKDMLTEINVTNVDSASFVDVATRETQLISYVIPQSPGNERMKVKAAIDDINKSTRTILTLDEQHRLKYTEGTVALPAEIKKITDDDLINWSITSINGKTFRNAEVRYRHRDIDRFTQASGNNLVTFSSEFVERYIGTDRTDEIDVYLYDEFDANIFSHRHVYYNSLGRSDLELNSDLRLADIEIGDVIDLELDRLYKRFGDPNARQKLCSVVGKTQDGEKVKLFLSDLGNTFNTSAFITDNAQPDFSSSTSADKLIGGYITTNVGIVDNDEDTDKTNLIS